MVRNIFATVLPALGLVLCNPAHADEQPQQMRQIKVSYADLDLSKNKDRTLLKRRVRAAVVRVCAGEGQFVPFDEVAWCQKRAFASSNAQLELAYAKSARLALATQTENPDAGR